MVLAIEECKAVNLTNLPSLTILTGDDTGQFELMKSQFLRQIQYDAADLNMTYFDMKEAVYPDVEIDLVSLPFFLKRRSSFWIIFGCDNS